MYTTAIVLFAAFALVFLTSCVLYFMGKRTLLRFVMQWATIVLLALWTVEPLRVAWSVAGAVALNLVLAMNHRPGRYMAV